MKRKKRFLLTLCSAMLLWSVLFSFSVYAAEEDTGTEGPGIIAEDAATGQTEVPETTAESASGTGLVKESFDESAAEGEIGPGIKKEEAEPLPEEPAYKKGNSLGIFNTTAYCGCDLCSGGSGLTYSGTVPKANHTLSADLDVLPLGTKVMIGDVVYTVEDMGSGVNGQKVDIYFSTHAEALEYGTKKMEIFEVIEE